ncbi:hypothetical protein PISMIDRAFT_688550 [Pisolithus microcarpus 441]|uniref:Uncharacterized protein n=1 Tax=Pisolithus microcarpus 441 TaxID=765257 RepID=A0A0C9YII6_9AGAM|nr:hypothetical protein PISMIDRAFT_688550 [Pisolithus microcarpus 441]
MHTANPPSSHHSQPVEDSHFVCRLSRSLGMPRGNGVAINQLIKPPIIHSCLITRAVLPG